MKYLKMIIWLLVAMGGALALGMIATVRGEHLNAMWLVAAGGCTYALGYRFYSRFVAARVLELDNRRALTAIPDAAIAMPRAPACGAGRCWPDADEGATETIAAIRDAARTCFGDHASYGVVGFSRGGYALARLGECNTVGARWAVVASAFGYTEDLRLRDCPVAIIVGRRDRYQHDGALGYAQRRRAAGLPSMLFEFDGGHRLDTESLASAIDALDQNTRGR